MPQCERLKWGAKMEEQEKEYEQDKWKIALRSELVIAMAGDLRERKHAYGEIGYYRRDAGELENAYIVKSGRGFSVHSRCVTAKA